MAGACALCTGVGVFCLAIAVAVYLSYAESEQRIAQFKADAQRILDTAALGGGTSAEGERALRLVLEVETRRGTFGRAVIGAASKIIVAGDASLVGLDGEFALVRPALHEHLATLPADGGIHVAQHGDPPRLEGIAVFGYTPDDAPIWMYVSLSYGSVSGPARRRMLTMLACGAILALGAGVLVWVLLRRGVVAPIKQLVDEVENNGLGDTAALADELGELKGLAELLDEASARLLEPEQQRSADLAGRLARSTEYATTQGDFIHVLLRDLRRSMSAVLGHAELMVTGAPHPADRLNCIRAIQAEARRISRLAHDIRTVLPGGEKELPDQTVEWPLARLKEVVQQLERASGVMLHFGGPGGHERARLRQSTDDGGLMNDVTMLPPPPAVIRHMRGTLLLIGRVDPRTRIVREFNDMGIDTVCVPDLAAADREMVDGDYDVVIVCLGGLEIELGEIVPRLRRHNESVPIVGVLPETARTHGEALKTLGFATWLYEPMSRSSVLAGLGQFFDFSTQST